MSDFALAEAFVEFGAHDTALFESISKIGESLKDFELKWSKIATIGKAAFLSIAGAAVFVATKAMEASDAFEEMKTALHDDKAATELEEYAKSLQMITRYSKDAVEQGITYAAQLGVQADQMKLVTEVGIGLAKKFFGGELREGMRAAALATNGNFRELQKLIPQLRYTTNAYAQLSLVQRAGLEGFQQEEDVDSTSKALSELWHELGEVAEQFGKHLLPYLKEAAKWFEALAIKIEQLTPVQTKSIVKWVAIGAAIAGVIGLAPEFVAFGKIIIATIGGIIEAVIALGEVMGAAMLAPFGLVILGIGAMATAFAYFIGVGKTAVDKTIDGFMQMASFLDHLLGSWKGFTTGVEILYDQMGSYLLEGWVNLKNYLLDGWEYLAEGISTAWWDAFEGMNLAWNTLKTAAKEFMNWFVSSWSAMTTSLGDMIADAFAGEETQFTKDYKKKERATRDAGINKQYGLDQAAIDSDYNKNSASIKSSFGEARDESQKKRQDNRAANDKQANKDLADAELARQKNLKDGMAKIDAMPKLTDDIKKLYDKIKSGVGLDGIQKLLDGIQKEADDLKAKAKDEANKGGKGNLRPNRGVATGDMKMEDIGETFKRMAAMRMMGGSGDMNSQIDVAKAALVENQKQTPILQGIAANTGKMASNPGWARAA